MMCTEYVKYLIYTTWDELLKDLEVKADENSSHFLLSRKFYKKLHEIKYSNFNGIFVWQPINFKNKEGNRIRKRIYFTLPEANGMQRTLGSLRGNEIPTFAICAWIPFAMRALTAASADTGDSKSTKP